MDTLAAPAPQRSKLAVRPALLTALLLPWLFIWQGVDVTDQGYLLTIYRQFLHHPESVGQAAHMWLTNVLGGVWDALFGELGAIAHRAQWAVCVNLGSWIGFCVVRRLIGPRVAELALLATVLFVVNRRETWFSYNSLTALINAGVVHALILGLVDRRPRFLVLAGVLLGLSPFGRLPNVVALSFLSAPLFVASIEPSRRAGALRELLLMLLGVAAGAGAALSIIALTGYFPVYRASLAGLFDPAVDQTGHGSSALLSQLLGDQTGAVLAGLGSVAVLAAVQLATAKVAPVARRVVLVVIALGAIYGLGNFGGGSDPERWRYFVLGACEVLLALAALGVFKLDLPLRIGAFLCLVELVFTPIGSDQGTRNSHWGMWVSLPFVLALPFALENAGLRLPRVGELAFVFAAIVAGEGVVRARTYTYREGPRARLTHPIPQPQLRGLRTTAERAKVLDEVVTALNAKVAPGDYLLTSESTPLLLYLSRTRPYLGIPWIMVDENPEQLKRLLARAPREKGCVPVLVRARGNTRRREWPLNADKGLDFKHAPARKVIASFLRAHRYKVTWRNSYFEILEPKAGKACR